jgi:diguanylate cyclase (GGDEF)-like protein
VTVPVSHIARKAASYQEPYFLLVGTAGVLVLLHQLPPTLRQADLGVLVFVAMAILSEWAHVPLARGATSLSFAIVLPTFVVYGQGAAALTMVTGYLLGHGLYDTRSWRVKLFNCGQYSLTCFAAGAAYHWVHGPPVLGVSLADLLGLAAFSLVFFIANHFLVGVAMTLEHPEESPRVIWGEPAKWEGLTYLITAPLGLAIVMLYSVRGLAGATTLFLVSLAVAFVFRLTFRLDSLNRELRTLYEAARELTQGLDLDTVKSKIFNIIERLGPYDHRALFIWDDQAQHLVCTDCVPERSPFQGASVNLGEGVIGRIAENRSAEIVHEPFDEDFERPPSADAPLPTSLVVSPLIAEGTLVGVLVLGSSQPGLHLENQVRLVTFLSDQAAAALSRALRYQETRQMAITDSKTGVYNYRFFYERLVDEIQRHEAKKKRFSLIFLDVDLLKDINDRFGHQVGDEVVRQVAELIKSQVRDTDEVARYGGEEFVVLLPGAGGEESLVVAERIRSAVETHDFSAHLGYGPAKVTLTAGVATYPDHATQPDELVFRADEAMYQGKHRGRNQVSLYVTARSAGELGPA